METIKLEVKNNVAFVTLNRPEVHNAFNALMIKEMTEVFRGFKNKSDLRLVVLKGEGASFSAGADLTWMKSMKEASLEENIQDSLKMATMFEEMNQLPIPLLAVIHGAAFGGGTGLISTCDYVLAEEKTKFGFTEVRLGLIPAVISPYVVAKVGETFSRAYFLSGEKFGVEQALRMGLIHQTATREDLCFKEDEVIQSFLQAGPIAAREAKKLIQLNFPHINLKEETCHRIAKLRTSSEGQEGMTSLLEKRKTSWIKNEKN